jgi:hypothetical protein
MSGRDQGPIGQGTVVGTPQIGTINGPKQRPSDTAFGGDGVVPTTQSTVSQLRGWPANAAQNILPPPGGRTEQILTDFQLQIGVAPPRVLRQLFERVFGKTSEMGGHGFPYNAEWSMIPHQWIARKAQSTGPNVRGTDDSVSIPAVFAGNVRLG